MPSITALLDMEKGTGNVSPPPPASMTVPSITPPLDMEKGAGKLSPAPPISLHMPSIAPSSDMQKGNRNVSPPPPVSLVVPAIALPWDMEKETGNVSPPPPVSLPVPLIAPPSDMEKGPGNVSPPPRGSPIMRPIMLQPSLEKDTGTLPQPPPRPQPKVWKPWLVPLMVMVDVSLFIYTMYVNDCPSQMLPAGEKCLFRDVLGRFSFQPYKDNMLLGPSSIALEKLGGLERDSVLHGESWRLFSCIWLHAGTIHLFLNMLSLLLVGVRLEQEFGFLKIGCLFLLAGFGGSVVSSLQDKKQISVGASGALFGLLGAMLSELFMNWTIYTKKCVSLSILMPVICVNMAIGLIPKVDASAHIGGFISGFFLGFVILTQPQYGYISRKKVPPGYTLKHEKPKYKRYQYILWIVAVLCLITVYSVGLGLLFSGKTV